MQARITINLTTEGLLEIWLNEQGRDLLVCALQHLSRENDHFHIGPKDMGELEVSSIAYRSSDTVIEWGKVMLRPDEWDARYFPHVMGDGEPTL
jgi:hypothetical protein